MNLIKGFMKIDNILLDKLTAQAKASPRLSLRPHHHMKGD